MLIPSISDGPFCNGPAVEYCVCSCKLALPKLFAGGSYDSMQHTQNHTASQLYRPLLDHPREHDVGLHGPYQSDFRPGGISFVRFRLLLIAGVVSLSNTLQYLHFTIPPLYNTSTLLYLHSTIPPVLHSTIPPLYNTSTLQYLHSTIPPLYNTSPPLYNTSTLQYLHSLALKFTSHQTKQRFPILADLRIY